MKAKSKSSSKRKSAVSASARSSGNNVRSQNGKDRTLVKYSLLDNVKFEWYLFLVKRKKHADKVVSLAKEFSGMLGRYVSYGYFQTRLSGGLSMSVSRHTLVAAGVTCLALIAVTFVLSFGFFPLNSGRMSGAMAADILRARAAVTVGAGSVEGNDEITAGLRAENQDGTPLSGRRVENRDTTLLSDWIPENQSVTPHATNSAVSLASIPETGETYLFGPDAFVPKKPLDMLDDVIYVGGSRIFTSVSNRAIEVKEAEQQSDTSYNTAVKEQNRAIKVISDYAPVTAVLRADTQSDWQGSFIWPADGPISSSYGYRIATVGSSNHKGIDISGSRGNEIYAAGDGEVIYSGSDGRFGKVIRVMHEPGVVTLYAHCNSLYVSAGDQVAEGQVIAGMGMTGSASGVHLHFEIIIDGVNVNPIRYLP